MTNRTFALGPIVASALLGAAALLFAASSASAGTERVSLASDGSETNATSTASAISADGRLVAFASLASNLVPDDTNGVSDIFLRDRTSGTTERISVGPGGVEANGQSQTPAISADGRFVAFASRARNLDPAKQTTSFDVFVVDRTLDTIERVSAAADGGDGNGDSFQPAISADGRFVAFASLAGNLVAGDSNATFDVFVRDRAAATTARVSVSSTQVQGNGASLSPRLSADGHRVVFHSLASNLVPSDSNGVNDVFVHDLDTGETVRVSVASDGTQGNQQSLAGTLSADGRFVAFDSDASNLVAGDGNGRTDVFVHDLTSGTTERVSVASDGSEGNGQSGFADPPSLSSDGRLVAFTSAAMNLVVGDDNFVTDVFVHDRQSGETRRANVAADGTQANAGSTLWASLSAAGDVVAFASSASNLVADDTNGVQDVFVNSLDCGNGVLDPGEECDDGNRLDGDCCSAHCTAEPAGTPCTDGDLCTTTDACDGAGKCVGSDPVVCPAPSDACHASGTCDPVTGACTPVVLPDGTPCDDGDACTTGDSCVAGACTSGETDPSACIDPWRCRGASLGFNDLMHLRPRLVTIADRLGSQSYWLGRPSSVCATAGVEVVPTPASGPVDDGLLTCQDVALARTGWKTPVFARRRASVENLLGAETLLLVAPRALCLRGRAPGESASPLLDDYQCYAAHLPGGSPPPAPTVVQVVDRFGSAQVALGRPNLLCTPAGVDGGSIAQPAANLVCYATRDGAGFGDPSAMRPLRLSIGTRYGVSTLALFGANRVCLPTAVQQIDLDRSSRRR